MRTSRLGVIAIALALTGVAPVGAAPKNTGPTMSEQAELDRLQKEQTDHQLKQQYGKAVVAARKAYLLQKKVTGEDARETIYRKQSLAQLLVQASDYVEAEQQYKELVAQAERLHGVESREAQMALQQLASVYTPLLRYDDQLKIYERIVPIAKKVHGELSQEHATALSMYGHVFFMKHEYSAALRVYEEQVRIVEALAKSKDDFSLLSTQRILGNLYWQSNQQAKAVAIFDKIIAAANASTTMPVQLKASTLWGVAMQYYYGGRPDLSKPLTKQVTEMFEKELARVEKANPDDVSIVGLLGQIGMNYQQTGDLANAEKAFMRAVALEDRRGGFAAWSGSLAELKRLQGKPKEALALYEKAEASLVKLSPRSVGAYTTQITDLLRELGDYKRAELLLQDQIARVAKEWGKRHTAYGFALMNLAKVHTAAGNIPKGEKLLVESLDAAERELATVLKTGTESDHAVYFSRNAHILDFAVGFHPAFAPKSSAAVRLGLTTLLRRKGRVLDAAATSLATVRTKLSPADKRLLDELATARAKLAKLMVAGAQGSPEAYQKEIAALESQIQKLEAEVGKKSASYRAATQTVELPAIQKLIPRDARLVEIVNYQPTDPKAPHAALVVPTANRPARRYAAYVLGPTGDPVFIDLGAAAAIDAAVEQLRKSIADPKNKKAIDHGRALYDLTMGKLAGKLGGAKHVLMAPDGTLNLVPFAALVDDKGAFLIKQLTFTYLTSGRDLLRLEVRTQAQGGGVVFADPTFDHGAPAPKPAGNTPSPPPGTRGSRSSDLASLLWPQLPGTAAEATAIEKTMRGLKIFRGKDATENALKKVRGPKILHLATHGFFLPDEAPPAAPRGATAPAGAAAAPPPTPTENPLLRSGLALAGANKLVSGDEDGILTALEASGLDLTGTKLVVLSACETGAGKVTNGDGVYGLRRALVIAGAESLVMTLWQVDDEATKELMSGYYKQLQAGKGRSSALRDVQLEIASRPQYAHPFYWASFLPAGNNGPLK